MSNILDLSSGWKLGFYPETKLNKWIQTFGNWEIREDYLTSRVSCYGSQIYANTDIIGDYNLEFDFSLESAGATLLTFINYSVQRLAYYSVVLREGSPVTVAYVYSALEEHKIKENAGEVLKKGNTYHFKACSVDKNISVFIDDRLICTFEDNLPCGKNNGFCIANGDVKIKSYSIKSPEGDVLFEDDFSQNSLLRKDDVMLSDLKCESWIDADIPGTVHSSLLKAGLIEDPYVHYNGEKQMWIDKCRWVYKKKFFVPAGMKGKNIKIEFGGVDYHGYFFLNGEKLCYHEGMFGGPYLNVTDKLNYEQENELIVCLLPSPFPPHSNVKPYIFQRWHFNMDIVTVGIWREVKLVAYDNVFISDVEFITKALDKDKATVYVSCALTSLAMWPFELKGAFVLISPDGDEIRSEFAPGFAQGCIKVEANLEVKNPMLWWPNGMGEQNLYTLKIYVDNFEHSKSELPTGHAEISIKTGIRLLEMKPSPNKSGTYDWVMSINGREFFGKGSNWMPLDQMLRLPKEKYVKMLTLARECNINILRPWGAGLIETDDFFEVCDELGICVWQELLMANGFYNKINRRVWRETLTSNVIRLRTHPSLVMWCAGNEFDPDCIENKDVVDDMENICKSLDPSRDFHRASPYGGDSHSYQVNWMEGMYYTRYTTDLSVAVTEFSMASPSCMDTLKKLIPEDEFDKWPYNLPDKIDRYDYQSWGEDIKREESGFSIHDAHLSSITNVMFPAMSDVGKPKSLEEFVLYMQTAHGMLTQFGIDFWRSRFPYCTMAMSWVFNEICPLSITWSYVDGYGVPKASYYYKKRAYENVRITAIFDELMNLAGSEFKAKLTVINENLERIDNAKINVRLYDIELKLLKSIEITKNIEADDVVAAGFFQYNIPCNAHDGVMFLVADINDTNGNLICRSVYCPRVGTPSRRAPYFENGPFISDVKNAQTTLEASYDNGVVTITNTGEIPAFSVYISAQGFEEDMRYSDNYFWLESSESKKINISVADGVKELSVKSFNTPQVKIKL